MALATRNEPIIYSGVIQTTKIIALDWNGNGGRISSIIGICVLPFDFITDTILLPYKAYLITTEDAQAQEQPAQEEGSITHSTTTTVLEHP